MKLLRVTPKNSQCLYINPNYIVCLKSHQAGGAVLKITGESASVEKHLTKIDTTYEVLETVDDIISTLASLYAESIIVAKSIPIESAISSTVELAKKIVDNNQVSYSGPTQYVGGDDHLVIDSKAQAIEYFKKNPPTPQNPLVLNLPKVDDQNSFTNATMPALDINDPLKKAKNPIKS